MAGTCECDNEISGCRDWMELGQDRERWRSIVSTVMNCRFVGTG
jgi:peptide subunit release factor RF-3